MPKYSAIIYASSGDRELLERTLQSLQVCDDMLLINADADQEIRSIGRRLHARMKNGIPGVTPGAYLMDTYHQWILVLRPGEAISDELRNSLRDWHRQKRDENPGFRFSVLEQNHFGWRLRPPELRLVNRRKINWTGELPPNSDAPTLRGPLLRFSRDEDQQKVAS